MCHFFSKTNLNKLITKINFFIMKKLKIKVIYLVIIFLINKNIKKYRNIWLKWMKLSQNRNLTLPMFFLKK